MREWLVAVAKRKILYPVIKETKYWEDAWDSELNGTPRVVKGSLINYMDNYSLQLLQEGRDLSDYYKNIELAENKVFHDVLTYDRVERGRSACTFFFKGEDQAEYPMFITDMDDILKTKDISSGQVSGTWTFAKRGANYGIKLYEEN